MQLEKSWCDHPMCGAVEQSVQRKYRVTFGLRYRFGTTIRIGQMTPRREDVAMRFRARIDQNGKTATGIRVPAQIVEALGAGKRPPVKVTIGGKSYRTTVAPMGGEFLVGVSAENRALTGVSAGDEVDVDLELDTEPREVTLPADLAAALDADPAIRQRFDRLAFSHRKEHVRAIEDAKTPQTRERRISKAIELLRHDAAKR